ncbi:hypothetical protein LGMS210922A_17110 [Lactococcus garvieae]|nr:hypothetical protein LGMS210922A_05210 [Lactococcus garvieae]BDM76766.1 hypothetical protein LGMS210922A_17110 [Lactococcus garvieae]BDW50845.1 hypothetical protein LG21E68_05200 [Lactococcus garvieae]BDW52034.1 hypothetical protein LG21E68_17090 [Lactococcus garvieae]
MVLQELGQADTGHDGPFAIVFHKDILVFGVSIVVVVYTATDIDLYGVFSVIDGLLVEGLESHGPADEAKQGEESNVP